LNAVGDVANRLGDAAVAGDEVEEFKMVDVHGFARPVLPGISDSLMIGKLRQSPAGCNA
jgi:hypothetical protein